MDNSKLNFDNLTGRVYTFPSGKRNVDPGEFTSFKNPESPIIYC